MKRLLRIEQAKAKERQGERTSVENKTDVVRADTETAKQFGIAKDTMRKEMSIVDHRDALVCTAENRSESLSRNWDGYNCQRICISNLRSRSL